ncbi:site-specific tyrosine recombinase XerD, partial [Micrococcus luteus]|nr:site-specific tyrosine recombinase XerD [Micrococcus luteus]
MARVSADPAPRGSRGGRGAESALAAPFRRHLEHLAVERGLAANTLAAYRRDLERYRRWLEAQGVRAPADVAPGPVSGFLRAPGTGEDGGRPLAVRSAARVLAAVRGLHR